MPAGVFSILPGNFFSVLASINKQHYAALLVLYYRLFQENSSGLERELVVREFTNYLALHHDTLADEDEEAEAAAEIAATGGIDAVKASEEKPAGDERTLAGKFLRRFIKTGWLGEEILADFSRVINITAWGRPFMKALADIEGGQKTEYESHVVTVYSMLCGETIKKDGHHAVLKAYEETRSLIDSLKVLSQSIKGFYDKLNAEAIRSNASSVLHEHYNLYMDEVLDKAYKRLKTSDNVSRYRIGIFKQAAKLLGDAQWLNESAEKYMRILQTSRDACREKLEFMLKEISDGLRAVDPLEDEIDRRNAAYSRSSTEIIKAYIEPDSTVAGKIGLLIKAVREDACPDGREAQLLIPHHLHRIRFLSPATLAFAQKRAEGNFVSGSSRADIEALFQTEKEFLERMQKRLSIKRIDAWLDAQGGIDRMLVPAELITDEESYIRFIYALLYGDSRNNFAYTIEEDDEKNAKTVRAADYLVPDIRFHRKRNEPGP
ncbi:MAG: DUF5716 family protein [Treponema sp.]|nr:DUF5716 family protein [Treponema sp.]